MPRPSDFDVSLFNISNSTRVASGKMTMEIIAPKRKFFFTYDVLSGPALQAILDVIYTMNPFFVFEYNEYDDGPMQSAVVYVGEIARKRYRTNGVWYWKDVNFNFIEQ